MASAFLGTIAELKKLNKSKTLGTELAKNYSINFGRSPESQISSWENSIPEILRYLDDSIFNTLLVIIEYRMPIGDERTDLILFGGELNHKRGIVIELKQWSSIEPSESPNLLKVPGEGKQTHPSAQVLNYQGKLKALHSLGAHVNWNSYAFLHNLSTQYKEILESDRFSTLIKNAPIFYKETAFGIRDAVLEHLYPNELSKEYVASFDEGRFEQSYHFFDIIRKNADEIANNVTIAIAETGAGLTNEQLTIVETVLASVKSKEKVFLISGGPGSGKSLLSVHLLLRLISNGQSTVLALRNNRLMTILRTCFDQSYPGASGATIYSSVPRSQRGLGDKGFKGYFDCVVCDEAQRFGFNNIEVIMQRAPTVVFFYDESQILNPPEEGTGENFKNIARKLNKSIELLKLSSAMRCRGGDYYHEWVENLINSNIINGLNNQQRWGTNYSLKLFEGINEMISHMKELSNRFRMALVASFTESPGKIGSPFHIDNIRIGYPLKSGFDIYRGSNLTIPWLMDPRKDYAPFWLEGHSNKLDRVASIYGCQGFESDYVGVIWGRDFVWRNNKWVVGLLECITDNIDGLKRKAQSDRDSISPLLRNRYRIFLTRGILGTFIFCEDEETKSYLRSLFK